MKKQFILYTTEKAVLTIAVLFICVFCNPAFAQPSGGPYGPVPTTYEIPPDAGTVYFVSPDGKSDQQGRSIDMPATLEEAIKKAATGDVIILRGGTYRIGNLILNQGITLQPYKDELPVLKGTFVADKWQSPQVGLWFTNWEHLFPSAPADWWRYDREILYTPMHRFNNDMVFVNGRMLQSAGWEGHLDENSFYIDYTTKKVYLGFDPAGKEIEITAFNSAIIRTIGEVNGKKTDGIGPKIKGITFTQYAYRAIEIEGKDPEGISPETEHGKEVVGTLFENCTISYCSRVAGYFRGDRMTFRNCKISDTSTEGLFILSSNDVLLERNIFARNNIENITGYYPAAVKIFNQCYRVTCNDNLVIDHPNSNGIWYDVGNVDGVFTNNWVQNVGYVDYSINTNQLWPSQNGFFFEISKGAVCAGNVFVNCDHGIMILNSSNVEMYQNTFINSIACFGRDQRSAQGDHFGWHPGTGPDVEERVGHVFVNNLLAGDEQFRRPQVFVWQPDFMCSRLPGSPLEQFDNNVFCTAPGSPEAPLIIWSPVPGEKCQLFANDLTSLQRFYPEYNKNGSFLKNRVLPFMSTDLGNYKLVNPSKINSNAIPLPKKIATLLKLPGKIKPYTGAYPAM